MNNEIYSQRLIKSPVENVYQAFANPDVLAKWWGPNGFTNTIHEFELKPGGRWILTMHGPEKGNYENSSVFQTVEPNRRITWKRVSQPWFDMEIAFKEISDVETLFSFRMIFDSEEECNKIRRFAEPSNEENFDRLEAVLRLETT